MRKWLPLFAACLGTLMLLIDVTIVNVALPDIADGLGAGLSGLQWVVDGYALALAALLLVLGSFADRFGAERTYLAGLVVFAVASLACGLAGSTELLVVARAVQGIGGAAVFATTLSLLHATYTGRDRGIAFGAWGAIAGAAAGIGVVLGGVLTDLLSWRWIFLVNLPIAASRSSCRCRRSARRSGGPTGAWTSPGWWPSPARRPPSPTASSVAANTAGATARRWRPWRSAHWPRLASW